MRNLYVVTHAQSTHHVDHLVGGWYDSTLTELGHRQAEAIGRRIRALIPTQAKAELYSSDLMRTHQTAEAIARALVVSIEAMADLREMSWGEAEGKPQAWLDERRVYPARDDNRMDHRPGIEGAESRREVAERIYHAMDRIWARESEHQVIVTHGFALTFVLTAWIKMPIDAAGYIFVSSTSGGISHLLEDDRLHSRVIERLNDTSHLAGIEV